MISPSGNRVSGERTLDYFIAHEITHTLTAELVGAIAYHRLPQWKREGYADYVGKGEAFNYDEAKRAFLAGDPKMDWAKSGLYWRFHLLVAHLLDKQHWSVRRLLEDPIEQQVVEDEIRASAVRSSHSNDHFDILSFAGLAEPNPFANVCQVSRPNPCLGTMVFRVRSLRDAMDFVRVKLEFLA
ncbi:MAG: hypothetical protein J2P21_33620 [Chloracidobacterium sp.]|nr:hypothetical protein [Chloracidobacterium sp.]